MSPAGLLLGLFLIVCGSYLCYAAYDGFATGIMKPRRGSQKIFRSKRPAVFYLSICAHALTGVMLIVAGIGALIRR